MDCPSHRQTPWAVDQLAKEQNGSKWNLKRVAGGQISRPSAQNLTDFIKKNTTVVSVLNE